MASSSDIFAQVRSAVDLVEIIGEHVALKRAGREFKGLCPFHEDHRPSMAVVPHKQIFHCFVCGTGGDIFKFMELYHKMSKGEALRELAKRAGIKLPDLPGRRTDHKDKDGLSPRERIANTNEWACAYFEKNLRTPAGKTGLAYLHSRGLSDETIARFRLGFAPDSWTGLVNDAFRTQSAALNPQNLAEAGLIKQRADSSPYDAFRNRVIFPIIDATGGAGGKGRVIAFGGRVLDEKRDQAGNVVEAKYLNSPDTRLFNKSESLYGLNLARQHIVRTRTAVVVEGYMDVIACHQAGVTNVIATLGTALTPEHARILKNYAQTIILVFDSDDAGRHAADRAMEVFVRSPLDVKIAAVPDGKDPCDFCMKHGGPEFEKILEGAEDALAFKWRRLKGNVSSTNSVTARQDSITDYLRFAAAAMQAEGREMDPVRRGQLIVRLSAIVGLPVSDVTQMLFRLSQFNLPSSARTATAGQARAADGVSNVLPTDAHSRAERWLIGFVLHEPALYESIEEHISLNLFVREFLKAELFLEYFEDTKGSERSLAGFCGYAAEKENSDPVLQAMIRWEREGAAWVELTQFSADTARLIAALRKDRLVSVESVVKDCLEVLIEAAEVRMRLRNLDAMYGEMSDEGHFKEIANIAERNAAGKNYGNVGYVGRSVPEPSSGLKAVQEAEDSLRRTA